jgi:hypothetical protein
MKSQTYALLGIILIVALILTSLVATGYEKADPRAQLTFNHEFHLTEVEATCDNCHQGVTVSSSADDNLYPTKAHCAECHDVEDQGECKTCHTNPDAVTPIPGFHPNYELFEHSHHSEAGYACGICHAEVEKSTQWSADQQALPLMNQCMDCHQAEGQTMECSTCHYGKHPQPGDLNFTEWTLRHGLEAALDPEYFEQYFELGYCEDCHQGLNLKGDVHQPGWLFVHSDEAMMGGECFVCHEDRTECSECHRALLPIPHPLCDPAFANSETGGGHKAEAKAFFEACLNCHDMGSASPTCDRCH